MGLIKKSNEIAIQRNVKMMVYGQAGMGKAQPLFSSVLTPSGCKPMGNIRVGDEVLTSDGKVQQVLGVFPQGLRPYYRVVTNDGCECFCDIDHIWTVRNSTGNSRKAGWRNMTLAQMIEKGIMCPLSPSAFARNRKPSPRYEIPVGKACAFQRKDLPVDAYILGVLIGDGSMTGSVVAFSSPESDIFIKDKVEGRLPDEYYLTVHDGGCPQYVIAQKRQGGKNGFKKKISDLGLDVHSAGKFIPKEYLVSSVEQRTDLLHGLMDTDGSCIDNRTTFSTTSSKLAQDVVELVRSLGGTATINYYVREDRDSEEYRVRIRMSECPFSLPRKADEWSPVVPSRYIVMAEKMGWTECQCIKVSGEDELYMTDDFIVTHNTTLALSAPKPLLLDFDNGVKRVNNAHLDDSIGIVQITKWAEVVQLLTQEQADLQEFETIVVDTIGKMMDFIIAYRCAGRQPRVQDWGTINNDFKWFVATLSSLNKHVIFVAHRDSRKEGDDTVFIPALREKNYNSIVTELDLLGYVEMRNENGVQKRSITFDPTSRNDGKNTCQLPGVMIIPNILDGYGQSVAPNNFITAQIISKYQSMIAVKEEAVKKYNAVLEEIKIGVDQITNAKGANHFIAHIRDYAEHGNSVILYARDLFSKKMKELGLKYNKGTKTYEDATDAA